MGTADERFRYAVDFSIDGDLRFIAHNDCVRMFSRAAVRAKLPVSFTQGFNPRARVTLPFPRPVGQASDVERLLIDLTQEVDAPWLIKSLQSQLPDGAVLRRARSWPRSSPCRPRWVRYRICCADICAQTDRTDILDLLGSTETLITRVRHRDSFSRQVNIRPFIDTITVKDRELFVSVYITDSGSASPVEVCKALGREACAANHLVRRVEIQWQQETQDKRP